MLKRVDIEHLRVGMFVHGFCGSWMEHPFLRARFLLDQPHDLERLLATTVRQVWIDTSKGADIADHISAAEVAASVVTEATTTQPQPIQAASTRVELLQARKIISQACDVLKDMLHDVRLGHPVNLPASGLLVEEMTQSIQRNPHALISLVRLKTADNYSYMHASLCALS